MACNPERLVDGEGYWAGMFSYGILLVVGLVLMYVFLRFPVASLILVGFLIPVEELSLFMNRSILVPVVALGLSSWLMRILLLRDTSVTVAKKSAVFVIAWMVWGLASFYWAMDPELVLSRVWTLASLVVFFFFVQGICLRSQDITVMLLALVMGVTIASVNGITQFVASGAKRMILLPNQNPNMLARSIATGILTTPYLFRSCRRIWQRVALSVSLIINSLALILTGSRGAFVAFIAALFGVGIITTCKHRRVNVVAVIALLFVIGGTCYVLPRMRLMPQRAIDRLMNWQSINMRTAGGRLEIWQTAAGTIMQKPIMGIGLGNFPLIFGELPLDGVARSVQAHNVFIAVQTELGIIGTILFMLFLSSTVLSLYSVTNDIRGITGVLLVLFTLTSGLSANTLYTKLFWLILGIGTAIPRVVVKEQRVERDMPTPSTAARVFW